MKYLLIGLLFINTSYAGIAYGEFTLPADRSTDVSEQYWAYFLRGYIDSSLEGK